MQVVTDTTVEWAEGTLTGVSGVDGGLRLTDPAWTSQTSPVDHDWYSIAWSPQLGMFAAVANTGTGNRVMTSPDGTAWTSQTTPDQEWCAIAWSPELGMFTAVDRGFGSPTSRVMSSVDGVTWSLSPTPNNRWMSIAWSPELGMFAAVAETGTANRVMTATPIGQRTSPPIDIPPTPGVASSIAWSAVTPPNTTVTVETSVNGAAYQSVVNGAPIPGLSESGGTVTHKVTMTTTDFASTPTMDWLTVTATGPSAPSNRIGGTGAIRRGGRNR